MRAVTSAANQMTVRPSAPAGAETHVTLAGAGAELLPGYPYPGLRPFTQDEWPIFKGRDRLIRDILVLLAKSSFVSVLGLSGSGKSSLVRAGVLATLERRHGRVGVRWFTMTIWPGGSPLWSLAEGLLRSFRPELVGDDDKVPPAEVARLRTLVDASDRGVAVVMEEFDLTDTDNFLLVVDQFEELFRYELHDDDRERAHSSNCWSTSRAVSQRASMSSRPCVRSIWGSARASMDWRSA